MTPKCPVICRLGRYKISYSSTFLLQHQSAVCARERVLPLHVYGQIKMAFWRLAGYGMNAYVI